MIAAAGNIPPSVRRCLPALFGEQARMSIRTAHSFGFDPSYGFDLDELHALRPPAAPPRFDVFWRERYVRALGIEPTPRLRPSETRHPDWHVEDITYTSTLGF